MRIIADRRALHRIPELELCLPRTMEYLKESLSALNCRVFSPAESALCAFFDFGADHAIAFRADCDGLPITERSGAEYASTHPGCMHACGHDGHMAILLELARRLNEKSALPHNVLLVFQPGEETPGGARILCESGVLAEYGVQAIFGLHLWPSLEKGAVFCRENELMAHASEMTVDIYGRSAHIAKAREGIDATAAAVELYRRAAEVERACPDPYRLLKFGQLHSGTARNAISAHCHMEGCLRAFRDETFEGLKNAVTDIARDVEAAFGCRVDLHFSEGYPAVMNPPALVQKVRESVGFRELAEPSMTAEDFGWYQRYVPGAFFFLGLGDVPPLHADTFDFDESILLKGAEFFENLAENYR